MPFRSQATRRTINREQLGTGTNSQDTAMHLISGAIRHSHFVEGHQDLTLDLGKALA